MSPELARLVAAVGCATPLSMERPKRFAKELQKLFPNCSLSLCQEATAHVFGHQDWHQLHRAVDLGGPGRKPDCELSVDEIVDRQIAQGAILNIEITGLDPNDPYEPPPDEEVNPLAPGTSPQHAMLRMSQARNRLTKHLVAMLIVEQEPTDDARLSPQTVESLPWTMGSQDFMANFHKRIAQWWRVNIPYQPEVGQALESFSWDKDRTTSILRFAEYWGTLGVVFSDVIDFDLGPGTSYLLAEQYASSILFREDPEFRTEELFRAWVLNFMSIYPRDDFVVAFPTGLKSSAKIARKILSDPQSRKGTWETAR